MVWRTLAGYPNTSGTNDGPGISARLANPSGIALDLSGTAYVADSGNHLIRMIRSNGVVSTIAGQAGIAGWKDGAGTNALFSNPTGLALGPEGSLYVCDSGNCVLRRISPAGVVSTLAGSPGISGYQNGTGTNAWFNWLTGVTVGTNGWAYVTDGNFMVRRISPSGVVTILAGQPGNSGYTNGLGTNALFSNLNGIVLDSRGNLYVADSGNYVIRRITPEGEVTTWAGSAGSSGYQDGAGTNAWFAYPRGLGIDQQGNVYVADESCIRKISSGGQVTTLGGGSQLWGHLDGPGPFAWFSNPCGIAVDTSGHLLVVDSSDSTIRYGSAAAEARPQIITQPKAATLTIESNLTLFVEGRSATPLTYQWFANGQAIAEATSSRLTLTNLKETDAGEYRVAVSDGLAYMLSFPANVQVFLPPSNHAPLDNWRRVAGPPLGDIHGLAYGNGVYVAIGGGNAWSSASLNGAVATSTDGEHWVKQPPIVSESLNALVFGAGKFVVVGNRATVLTSSDGYRWQPQTLTTQGLPDLNGIIFAQGIFVAVSGDVHGSIWTSSDGITWANRGLDFGVSLMTVAAPGGQFVAAGNTILTSSNGLDWVPTAVPATYLGRQVLVEHLAGSTANTLPRQPWPTPWQARLPRKANGSATLLASEHWGSGFLAASATGLDWQEAAPTNTLLLGHVTFGNGHFLAVEGNSGGISVSDDGLTWTTPVLVTNRQRQASNPHLRFEHGLFLASGYEGALFASADGQSWTLCQVQRAMPFAPASLIRVGEQFWAGGGDSGLAVSDNGSDWDLLLPTNSFPWLAYGQGTMVAAGGNEIILSSQDGGASWTDRSPRFNYGSFSPQLSGITYGGGGFVAFGYRSYYNGNQNVQWSHLLASSNAIDWTQSNLDGSGYPINGVAYGAGLFVAIQAQQNSPILVSTNGASWKAASTRPSNWPSTIAFGNQRFVIGTSSGTMISTDGIAWREYAVPGASSVDKVVFGNGLFLASGWSPDSSREALFSSTDGIAWTRRATPAGNYWSLAAGTEGAFFITGEDNSLYQSAPFAVLADPRWLSPAQLEWAVSGPPQANYRVEFSEDLRSWQVLGRITNAPAAGGFTDSSAGQHLACFYRTVSE